MFEPDLHLPFVNFLSLPFKDCLICIFCEISYDYFSSVLFALSFDAADASASAFRL